MQNDLNSRLVVIGHEEIKRLNEALARAHDEIVRLKVAGQIADKLNVSVSLALSWSDEEIGERLLDI